MHSAACVPRGFTNRDTICNAATDMTKLNINYTICI